MIPSLQQPAKVLLTVLALIFLSGCGEDKEIIEGVQLSAEDKILLEKTNAYFEQSSTLWPGFDVRDYPVYFVVGDQSEARGFALNSPHLQANSRVAAQYAFNAVHRNDDYLTKFGTDFGWQFGVELDDKRKHTVFTFYESGLSNYMWPFYLAYKSSDYIFYPGMVLHEVFHAHQIATWQQTAPPPVSPSAYRFSEEELTLMIFQMFLMHDVYKNVREYPDQKLLKLYTVLWLKLLSLDSSQGQSVTLGHMLTEATEGSARYLEHFAGVPTIYPNLGEDPSHGWMNEAFTTTSRGVLLHFFDKRLWYSTGAAACYLLSKEKNDFFELARSKSLAKIAIEHLNLSEDEVNQELSNLVSSAKWIDAMNQAKRIEKILYP